MIVNGCGHRGPTARCLAGGLGTDDWSGATGVPSYSVATTPTPASSTPSWLQNLISGAFGTAEKVLVAKTQTKGVLTQTSPGVFTYVQPEGSQVTLPVNVSPAGTLGVSATTSSGMGLVLVGGAALLVVMMLARKG